ncbi:MAG: DUF4215 protein [Candidatus Magasanikbacteria bacterium]|nr:DUF4215 protein [Candidatus Magasanikbacteria bacterium]
MNRINITENKEQRTLHGQKNRAVQKSFLIGEHDFCTARFFCALFLVFSFSFFILFSAPPVHAQVETGLTELAQANTGLATTDIRLIIARIIRIVLSLLGVIAIGIVLYGGFAWMTAAGSEEKIGTAKKILTNGAIGLVIVLSAFAITQFVLTSLQTATGTQIPGEAAVGGGGLGGAGGGGGGFGKTFVLKKITPTGTVGIRNVKVRLGFSKDIQPDSVGKNITITSGGQPVPVAQLVQGSEITLTPDEFCESPNQNIHCFRPGGTFNLQVAGTLKAADGSSLSCSTGNPCQGTFTVGMLIDATAPNAAITTPDNNESIAIGAPLDWRATVNDDSGIAKVEFIADGAVIDSVYGKSGEVGTVNWLTDALAPKSTHKLEVRAYDLDDHDVTSAAVGVIARAPHCFDGKQTPSTDETGVDCSLAGGDCGLCAGANCQQSADCGSGLCENGTCVELPKITGVTPKDGAAGTVITITGVNFGVNAGTVKFLGDPNDQTDDVAAPYATCGYGAFVPWTTNKIFVIAPATAKNGPLEVKTDKGTDRTNDDYGPFFSGVFTLSNVVRPSVCAVVPEHGVANETPVTIYGAGFGAKQDKSNLLFGGNSAASVTWSDTVLSATIPNLSAGATNVFVKVAAESNGVPFIVEAPNLGTAPTIQTLSPNVGPPGQYLTVTGAGFGMYKNKAYFIPLAADGAEGTPVLADLIFPDGCKNTWADTKLILKAPKANAGEYLVQVFSSSAKDGSNKVKFQVTDGAAGPGLCSIVPDNGPASGAYPVILYGENFGSQGSVRFTGTAGTSELGGLATGAYKDKQISTAVPAGTISGAVRVFEDAKAPAGSTYSAAFCDQNPSICSNSVNFLVQDCNAAPQACAKGTTCCPAGFCGETCSPPAKTSSYTWAFTTSGEIDPELFPPKVVEECDQTGGGKTFPSPSPSTKWPDGTSVCSNFQMGVKFNIPVDPATLTVNQGALSTILVEKCVGTAEATCAAVDPAPVKLKDLEYLPVLKDKQSGFNVLPAEPLSGQTYYRVTLGTGIKGLNNQMNMAHTDSCGGNLNGAYCFLFQTNADNQPCKVGSVIVEPAEMTVDKLGVIKDPSNSSAALFYRATPLAEGKPCIQLNPKLFNWDWRPALETDSGYGNAQIDFIAGTESAYKQQVLAKKKTDENKPVSISAKEMASQKLGKGLLTIKPVKPAVLEQCDAKIQSPTPWDGRTGGANVCVNAAVKMGSVEGELTASAQNDDLDLALFEPAASLVKNSTYRVLVSTNVKSAANESMPENKNCGVGLAYCFNFKTRDSDEKCAVTSVNVTPSSITAVTYGRIKNQDGTDVDFLGNPHPDDPCIVLNPQDYTWKWLVDAAHELNVKLADAATAEKKQVDALKSTGPSSPAKVTATVQNIAGESQVTVAIPNPQVIAYAPNCAAACVNAKISATVNQAMNAASVTPGNVRLYTCDDEGCLVPLDDAAHRVDATVSALEIESAQKTKITEIEIKPVNGLKKNTYYRAALFGGDTGVTSANLAPLSGMNYPLDAPTAFSWKFKTKDDDKLCAIDKVDVQPLSFVTSKIGVVQKFAAKAYAAKDSCSPQAGQELRATDYNWSWNSTDAEVALLFSGGTPPVYGQPLDVLPVAGGACTSICTNLGSTAFPATCGNNKVELGEDCDDGNLINGDGCGKSCLAEGAYVIKDADGKITAESLCGNKKVEFSHNLAKYGGEQCDGTPGCTDKCLLSGSGTTTSTAAVAGVVCGNGDIGPGEACDDKNLISNDGCSTSCLREGSAPHDAVCGNGEIESGEDCDDNNTKIGDGCNAGCLAEGSFVQKDSVGKILSKSTCGNGKVEYPNKRINEGGEQCDGGAGCTPQCLFGGSVNGAICGNGVRETGETCEAQTGADSLTDPVQYFYAKGNGKLLDGAQSSFIKALAELKEGSATFKIQCGFTNDADCAAAFGVDNKTCCSPHPKIIPSSAAPSGPGACRNPAITFAFDRKLDPSTLSGNVYLAKVLDDPSVCAANNWPVLRSFGDPLRYSCALPDIIGSAVVTDSGHGSIVTLPVNKVLDPGKDYATQYEFFVYGVKDGKKGVTGLDGVSITNASGAPSASWAFWTGENICALNKVTIDPKASTLTKAGAQITLKAVADSTHGGVQQEISGIPNVYDWKWQWGGNSDSVKLAGGADSQAAIVEALNKNGVAQINVQAVISADNISAVSTVGKTVSGAGTVQVQLCEHPWQGLPEQVVSKYDFALWYCKDGGNGALSEMTWNEIPGYDEAGVPTTGDPETLDIYQLQNPLINSATGQKDSIAIRIFKNPGHLSALDWYHSKNFQGTPTELKIGGYRAVRDGNTIFVDFANVSGHTIYTNIMAVALSSAAGAEATEIFEQVLKNIRFNISLDGKSSGVCEKNTLKNCGADYECDAGAVVGVCLSSRSKVARDTIRLEDFVNISNLLGKAKLGGSYPLLAAGSFIPGYAVSKWNAWITLGNALGQALPTDPLNVFNQCPAGYDSNTCWNAASADFVCPSGSHVYVYRVNSAGYQLASDFEFKDAAFPGLPLQYTTNNVCVKNMVAGAGGCGDGKISPNEECDGVLDQGIWHGYDVSVACTKDGVPGAKTAPCNKDCSQPDFTNVSCVTGPPTCGNGSVDYGELCDDGLQNGSYNSCNKTCNGFSALGYCGDKIIHDAKKDALGDVLPGHGVNFGETCDLGQRCSNNSKQSCGKDDDCLIYKNDGSLAGNSGPCVSMNIFGTNAIDSCRYDCKGPGPFCGNGAVEGIFEQCDGPVVCATTDGKYGLQKCTSFCSWASTDDNGQPICEEIPPQKTAPIPTCGDGKLDSNLGEQCDNGVANGTPCSPPYGKEQSCSYCSKDFCKLVYLSGGYCDDGKKNGNEQCDVQDYGCSSGTDYVEAACDSKCKLSSFEEAFPNFCKQCQTAKGANYILGAVIDNELGWLPGDETVALSYKNKPVLSLKTDSRPLLGLDLKPQYESSFDFKDLADDSACTPWRLVIKPVKPLDVSYKVMELDVDSSSPPPQVGPFVTLLLPEKNWIMTPILPKNWLRIVVEWDASSPLNNSFEMRAFAETLDVNHVRVSWNGLNEQTSNIVDTEKCRGWDGNGNVGASIIDQYVRSRCTDRYPYIEAWKFTKNDEKGVTIPKYTRLVTTVAPPNVGGLPVSFKFYLRIAKTNINVAARDIRDFKPKVTVYQPAVNGIIKAVQEFTTPNNYSSGATPPGYWYLFDYNSQSGFNGIFNVKNTFTVNEP